MNQSSQSRNEEARNQKLFKYGIGILVVAIVFLFLQPLPNNQVYCPSHFDSTLVAQYQSEGLDCLNDAVRDFAMNQQTVAQCKKFKHCVPCPDHG